MPFPLTRLLPAAVCFALAARATLAQTQPAPPSPQAAQPTDAPSPGTPQLSPRAAYDSAMHPLEMTRHNIANWSDVELAAMKVSIALAKDACLARTPETYAGAELLDLARLCALGQQWSPVALAATLYLEAPSDTPKPLLADAYIARMEADLRLNAEPNALADAQSLLTAVPYTANAADAVEEALQYLHLVYSVDALKLATARQPVLLSALQTAALPLSAAPAATPATAQQTTAPAPPPLHQLYSEALSLAALQQLVGKLDAAAATVAALDAALPSTLPADEALPIAAERRRYALLGKPLTGVTPTAFLQGALGGPGDRVHRAMPDLPARRTITALLLFPDWCAQCVRLGPRLPETVFSVQGHSAYLYALLAETVPQRKPASDSPDPSATPAYAAASLAGTPTLTVPSSTLNHFQAADFPFLILTDNQGIVRLLEPVGSDDLRPGGAIDSAIALVGRTFNPLPPKPATLPGPHVHAEP